MGTEARISGAAVTIGFDVDEHAINALDFVITGGTTPYAPLPASRILVQDGSGNAPATLEFLEHAKFVLDSDGNISQLQYVRSDGTVDTVTPSPQASLTKLDAGYVVVTVSDGTQNSFQLYYDSEGCGIYSIVAHGTETAVELVGVKAEPSSPIDV